MNAIRKFVHWVKTVMSEPDGTGSSARVAFLALIATCCVCILACSFVIVYLVVIFQKIPEGIEKMVGLIGALTGLTAAGAGAYSANKFSASGIVETIKQKLGGETKP